MKKLAFLLAIILSSSFSIIAQNNNNKEIRVKVKDDKKPTIYVDGKLFNFSMDLIDQDKIASASILKTEDAIKKYNAPNGVILITTKSLEKEKSINFNEEKSPKIFVNGVLKTKAYLETLSPRNIEKMEVIKGERAIKSYKSPNGVILITTKKE